MKKLTRRDRLYLIAKRADLLDAAQARRAWQYLTFQLEALGHPATAVLPKFDHLLQAIRAATIKAKKTP